MLELNITHMFKDKDTMRTLSGSVMELGENAGEITWHNSSDYAAKHPLLKTPEDFQEARNYFKEFGAWSKEELAAMPDCDIQALTVQFIAGDIREMEAYESFSDYEQDAIKGTVSGNIFQNGNDWYFTLYN